MHSSFLSKVLLIMEDEDVNDMWMKIKVSMTSCMILKTMIMVTRTKLLFVADIHTNACTYIIYNEQLYMQNPIFMIFTVKFYSYKQYTNLMKVCSCIIAYVYSQ